jgi:hypothetical protein
VLIIAHLVALILKQKYVSLKIKLPQPKKHIQLKEIVDNNCSKYIVSDTHIFFLSRGTMFEHFLFRIDNDLSFSLLTDLLMFATSFSSIFKEFIRLSFRMLFKSLKFPWTYQECQDEAVYCDCCNTWIHYKCEKLSKSDIKYFKQTPSELYTCMVCMDLLMFDSYNRDNTNIEIILTFVR